MLHVGDRFGRELAARVTAPLVRVSADPGTSASDAELAPISRVLSVRGIEARVRVPGGTVDLVSPLVGVHNLENLLVALGIVVALGLDVVRAADALRGELGAPGRLERCESKEDDVVVLVDYAHTPDALARVLASVRALAKGRVFLVFGCGGDRDRAKRVPMGEAAARGADIVIVTNDNPRGESPAEIGRRSRWVCRTSGSPVSRWRISRQPRGATPSSSTGHTPSTPPSRARLRGDTVLVCGKGHEDYQICGNVRLPFDDRVEARRALTRRRDRTRPEARGGP